MKTYFTIKGVRLIKERPEAMERSEAHKPKRFSDETLFIDVCFY